MTKLGDSFRPDCGFEKVGKRSAFTYEADFTSHERKQHTRLFDIGMAFMVGLVVVGLVAITVMYYV